MCNKKVIISIFLTRTSQLDCYEGKERGKKRVKEFEKSEWASESMSEWNGEWVKQWMIRPWSH